MAMPDPTLGRVQDTGHAGMRQGFQSIMDSLNQNSQMAMSAIENWKQRDYAAQEAEKERLFKADEALKTRTHESEENALTRQLQAEMNDKNNQTSMANAQTAAQASRDVAGIHSKTQKDIEASRQDSALDRLSAMLGADVTQWVDENGKKVRAKNTTGANKLNWGAPVFRKILDQNTQAQH